MADRIPLPIHTLFAELDERCRMAEFDRDFPENGSFERRERQGRAYWYYRGYDRGQRSVRYVGPESPALLDRLARHRKVKNDYRERRQIVDALGRAGLPMLDREVGAILTALARAGVFRLRGVLVGTTAFRAYVAMLGQRFPDETFPTQDLDLAQFHSISVAVEDSTPPILDVIRQVDPTFEPVPQLDAAAAPKAYANAAGYRVEILVPNRGSDELARSPARMPALGGSDAQPLRFLDFLIYQAVPTTLLYDAGIPVNVPRPERYAVHKLIVATRRQSGSPKITKDLAQADALVGALAGGRAADLAEAWIEACERGPRWLAAVRQGARGLSEASRNTLAQAVALYVDDTGLDARAFAP
ncbi:nucleotidyltransferase family protein [Zavarzinia sp. CC-PAN008]|uniref:nucleotidyltransferase family protein n=1 Tax=Zavarzinia sp. CC-PAN008 TaxID=3243332 RepID=UPI003F747795